MTSLTAREQFAADVAKATGHPALPSAREIALAKLEEIADDRVVASARHLDGDVADWEWDPDVPNVLGLLERFSREALIVVYLDEDDFEISHNGHQLIEHY